MLQEQPPPKEQDEKIDEKSQDKPKSETDEDTISAMDEESQSEPTESKVNIGLYTHNHSSIAHVYKLKLN